VDRDRAWARFLQPAGLAVLAEQVDVVPEPREGLCEARVVDVAAGAPQQVAVEDQYANELFSPARMTDKQKYRFRAPASGREAVAEVENPDAVIVDHETGEEMRPVTRVLPLAPSDSNLLRTPENLRECRRCHQLIGVDLSDCPYCGLRQEPLE
jgi:hypothetical protein